MNTLATCSRCSGSGRYAFNLRDGDRCYGCDGAGTVTRTPGQEKAAAKRQAAREKRQVAAQAKAAESAARRERLQPVLEARFGHLCTTLGDWRFVGLCGVAARELGLRSDRAEDVEKAL